MQKNDFSLFWTIKGPVFWELLPAGTIINSTVYCEQLNRVQQFLTENGHAEGKVLLLQDNARPHTSNVTRHHIEHTFGWELLPHPPYSPDLAPSDCLVFRSLKTHLRGKQFKNDKEVENAVADFFTSKSGTNFFKRGIRKLPQRWRIVILQKGEYIID